MAETRPRATILVPSYDHAPFVLGAVASALDQTDGDLEVIVIDDGSHDDSLARLATVDDPRVTVLAQENRGLSRTLNRGLELARGRWIKFLPSDDMMAPGCLARQLAAAEPGVGVVFALPEIVDAAGRPLADPTPQAWFDTAARDENELLLGLIERNFLSAPGALFERDLARAVGGFDAEMRVAQDYDLWLKLLPRTRARLVPERLVRVRWHGANQSAVATEATEAERARALQRALDDVGIDAWIARFAAAAAAAAGGARGVPADVVGRRALAGALTRSGLASVRDLARRLEAEADERARRRPGAAARRAAGALVRAGLAMARRAVAPAWKRALARGGEAARQEPRVSVGPLRERWLVVDAEPVPTADGSARGRRVAEALARAGAAVGYATRIGAGAAAAGPAGTSGGIAELPWDLGALRGWLAGHDARSRVVVAAPHPEAVALSRDAAAWGARVVYDRAAAWEGRRDVDWYDAESETRLVGDADDLVAAERSLVGRLAAGRRPVHVLPSPPRGDAASMRQAWDAVAASLRQIAERPTATAIAVAPGAAPGACQAVDALLRLRGSARVAIVLAEPSEAAVAAALEARAAAREIALLRSPSPAVGAAVELGLRATAGEVVALLELAAIDRLADGWLEPALRLLAAQGEVGAVEVGAGGPLAGPAGGSGPTSMLAGATPIPGWTPLATLGGAGLVARRAVLRALEGGPGEPPDVRGCAERIAAAGYRLARLL